MRNPFKDEELDKPTHIDGEMTPSSIRDDVQAAISVVGQRNLGLAELENDVGFTPDFHGANLRFANLVGHHLENADLQNARLEFAHFEGASLAKSFLRDANLYGSNLDGANFLCSDCRWATFGNARAIRANFH